MRKLLIFLSVVFFFGACNNNGGIGMGGGGWSKSDQNKFVSTCAEQAGNTPQAKQICACVMQKLQKKYRSVTEADAASQEEIREMAMGCQNAGGGNGNGFNDEENNDDFNNNNKNNKIMNNDEDNFGNNDDNGGNNNFQEAGWSKKDKNSFLGQCREGLTNNGYNDMQARQLCNCIVGKLEQKYSSLSEADQKGGANAGAKARQSCLAEMGNQEEY